MPPSGGPPERTRPPVATERSHRRHSPSSGPVALFVDWDNFAIGLRQEMPERPPDLGPILRWARRTGTLIVSRAYGEWRDATERLAIYNAGVDAVYAPVLPLGGSLAARSGAGGAKSLADTAMAVDVAEFLTLVPSVQTLILATSDKDLIPVIRFAQKRGVYSGVVGSDRTAAALRELADEFVTYRQLLEDEAPQPVAVSRPVTVPPLRIARPLRRFGEPSVEALAPVLREPRTFATSPVLTRREPVVPPVTDAIGEDPSQDPDSDSARRRRRGGRRRRGAETLALGDGTPLTDGGGSVEVADPAPRMHSTVPGPGVPTGATPRPAIVPPMIAPRAPRPSAERFASPVTVTSDGQRELGVDVAAPPVPSVAAVDPATAVLVDETPIAPVGVQTTTGQSDDPPPTRRPRVQLPGERLRRLAPGSDVPPTGGAGDISAGQSTDQGARAAAIAGDGPPTAFEGSEVRVEAASPAALATAVTPNQAEAPAAVEPVEDAPASEHPSVEASTEEAASRARRRRGGRTPRSAADGTPTAEKPPTIIDGPIASPNDPDAATAPETAADGPVRGRRRGGRARATA
jgi:uncharacterized LabA/DUF88 family protein